MRRRICRTYGAWDFVPIGTALTRWANVFRASGAKENGAGLRRRPLHSGKVSGEA